MRPCCEGVWVQSRQQKPEIKQRRRCCTEAVFPRVASNSNVRGQTHSLMKDTNEADARVANAINDDVSADKVSQMRWRQIFAAMTRSRVVANSLQGLVDLVAIGNQLTLAPGFASVAENIDEILSCLWRKDQRRRIRGEHPRLWADRCAWL